uniref:Uncharacterized protein n=1 Tax=Ursus americanus TaxID=9643 RepID=A0A452QQI9_URSAM
AVLAGIPGAWESSCLCQGTPFSLQMPPFNQQFPEAMTCPCSWRPSREGHRGLLGPVLPTEEGRQGRGPSDSTQVHSPLTQVTMKRNTLLPPYYCP